MAAPSARGSAMKPKRRYQMRIVLRGTPSAPAISTCVRRARTMWASVAAWDEVGAGVLDRTAAAIASVAVPTVLELPAHQNANGSKAQYAPLWLPSDSVA